MNKRGNRISVVVEAKIESYGKRRCGLLRSRHGYLVRQAEGIDSGVGNQGSWTK